MKSKLLKRFAIAAAALAVIFGCNSVIDHIVEEAALEGSGTEGTTGDLDSDFSDAPASPGGTGGVIIGGGNDGTGTDSQPVGEETRSFFAAFQIDPVAEDTAGPKFVVAGDIDQDGLLDLVSAWNQSQPIQLHLQRRDTDGNISFRTITLGGTFPIAIIAGVELGQINGDGWFDVVVLAKASGAAGWCPTEPPSEISRLAGEIIVLFSPGVASLIPDGDSWTQMILANPYVDDRWIHNQFPGIESVAFEDLQTKPENGGFTALAVGDMDNDGDDDIIVSLNPGGCTELGQEPPINTVDLWINPGFALDGDGIADAEKPEEWGAPPDITLSGGVPVSIYTDVPQVTDVDLNDIDGDGDLDVIAVYSDAITRNVSWARNPFIPTGAAAVVAGFSEMGEDICVGGGNPDAPCPNGDVDCTGAIEDGVCTPVSWRYQASDWELRPIGQVDTDANVVAIGDIDGDLFDDILVRSTPGQLVQWFRRPNPLVVQPEFPPNDPVPDRFNFPWPVFTLTEFDQQEPEGIAIGDITGDGNVEVMVAAEGGVFWFDGLAGGSVFDPWTPNVVIQDGPLDTTDPSLAGGTTVPGIGVGVGATDASTNINTILIVDLDGDGKNDIVGTLDRRSGTGLSDDRLVWYRNTLTDED